MPHLMSLRRDEPMLTTCNDDATPFMRFWEAVNEGLKRRGLPELMFRDARLEWEAVTKQ
jgi:hypothetical protein